MDSEARNAYQEFCRIVTFEKKAACNLPALPAGKRAALRWFSATCYKQGARVRGIELYHQVFGQGDAIFSHVSHVRGLQAVGDTADTRFLEASFYAHSDRPPAVTVYLNEAPVNTSEPSDCVFEFRGFLVNK